MFMDVSDFSDVMLAAKLGKGVKDLTVGDVIDNLPKPRKILFVTIRDNYVYCRQDRHETEEDISKLIRGCNELEQRIILYFMTQIFEDSKVQEIRREIQRLEDY